MTSRPVGIKPSRRSILLSTVMRPNGEVRFAAKRVAKSYFVGSRCQSAEVINTENPYQCPQQEVVHQNKNSWSAVHRTVPPRCHHKPSRLAMQWHLLTNIAGLA